MKLYSSEIPRFPGNVEKYTVTDSALEFLKLLVWIQANPTYSTTGFGVCGLEQQT